MWGRAGQVFVLNEGKFIDYQDGDWSKKDRHLEAEFSENGVILSAIGGADFYVSIDLDTIEVEFGYGPTIISLPSFTDNISNYLEDKGPFENMDFSNFMEILADLASLIDTSLRNLVNLFPGSDKRN